MMPIYIIYKYDCIYLSIYPYVYIWINVDDGTTLSYLPFRETRPACRVIERPCEPLMGTYKVISKSHISYAVDATSLPFFVDAASILFRELFSSLPFNAGIGLSNSLIVKEQKGQL